MRKTLPRETAGKEKIEGRTAGGGECSVGIAFEEIRESELNTEGTEEAQRARRMRGKG
jgi:hypothetical protein